MFKLYDSERPIPKFSAETDTETETVSVRFRFGNSYRNRNSLFSTFLHLTDNKNSNFTATIAANETKTQYHITTYNFPKNYVHILMPERREGRHFML